MNDERLKVCEVSLTYQTKVKPSERYKVTTSREVYNLLLGQVYDINTIEYKEHFKVLLLNQSNKVLGVHNLSIGGIDGVSADIRLVVQAAILGNASAIIVSHNHPSGNTDPSNADRRLTTQLKQACELLNIRLLDHVIVSTESYYSFADEGLI